MPTRIQRSRKTGWRKPAGKVLNITRPSRHGNPNPVKTWGLNQSLVLFEFYLDRMKQAEPDKYNALLDEVRRADFVMCWCKVTERCHGDIWIRRANERK